VLQWSLPLLARRKSLPALVVSISLRPSQSKPWALGSRQLANILPICEEKSPQPQAMRGNELICSAESFGAGVTLHAD